MKELGSKRAYPTLIGSERDINKYLIALIRTQKSLHDYRPILKDTLDQIKLSGSIDTKVLHEKYPPESISHEIPAWVTYTGDKIVMTL